MKNVLVALVLVATVLVSCGPDLSDIKEGMTQSEVKELLGEPNKTSSSSSSSTINGETESHEVATWEYNNIGTIEFENGEVVNTSN